MSVEAERFTLDTNILVYSVDHAAGARHHLAAEIVDRAVVCDCWLTLQALAEFYAVVTRKGAVSRGEAAAQASDWLDLFPCAAASQTALRTAFGAAAGRHTSFWDALLLATAVEAGCTAVLTEDMADGASFAGIRIYNPFAGTKLAAPARRLLGME